MWYLNPGSYNFKASIKTTNIPFPPLFLIWTFRFKNIIWWLSPWHELFNSILVNIPSYKEHEVLTKFSGQDRCWWEHCVWMTLVFNCFWTNGLSWSKYSSALQTALRKTPHFSEKSFFFFFGRVLILTTDISLCHFK